MTNLVCQVPETFDVPQELEADLDASLAEADRGDTLSAAELLARLGRIT